jgi:hypothetical protein
MSSPSYPNRDWIQQQDYRWSEAMDYIVQSYQNVASKLGVSTTAQTTPPPTISSLTVSKTSNGTLQAVIQDNNPISWGIKYFLEHSTTPNFAQPHVIDVGQSRQWNGPDISKDFPYWRAYSMYPGQTEASQVVYHNGPILTAPVQSSTGSGTSSGNGRQGGTGFGLVQNRTAPIRSISMGRR